MNSPEEDNWDVMAGEYVLGTIAGAERTMLQRIALFDSDFRERLVWWQEKLSVLDRDVALLEPSPDVWLSITQKLGFSDQNQPAVATVQPDRAQTKRPHQADLTGKPETGLNGLWRGWAVVATAASIVLGFLLWQKTDFSLLGNPSYEAMSIVSNEQSEAFWVVDGAPKSNKLRITAIAPPDSIAGKVYQLWLVKPENGGVTSVGLLTLEPGQSMVIDAPTRLADGVAAFAVSLEPTGGSPETAPTGPVLYQGTLLHLSTQPPI